MSRRASQLVTKIGVGMGDRYPISNSCVIPMPLCLSYRTWRACNLGDTAQPADTTLCSDDNCSICGIIKTSYDIGEYGKGTGWGRCVLDDPP